MKKPLYFLKKYPLFIGILCLVIGMSSIMVIDPMPDKTIGYVLPRIYLCIICGAAIY